MNWFWDNIHLKKEDRFGMIVFLCLIFLILLVKWYLVAFYHPKFNEYTEDLFSTVEYVEDQEVENDVKEAIKSYNKPLSKKAKKKKIQKTNSPAIELKMEKRLFHFDPNSVSVDSLLLLGFSKYSSNNIVKYRSKGGRFKKANDLYRIYGVDSLLVAGLQSFIKIENEKMTSKSKIVSESFTKKSYPKLELNSIDINSADTTDFKKLKGIGSVYSKRIVKFRNSLGGFFSIRQINDVWGISDSLFLAIEPYLSLDTSLLKKQNINSLNKELLVKHPYIDWKKAKAILKYKKMHGDYTSMDDFTKLHGIDSDFVDTLRLYFVAQ